MINLTKLGLNNYSEGIQKHIIQKITRFNSRRSNASIV